MSRLKSFAHRLFHYHQTPAGLRPPEDSGSHFLIQSIENVSSVANDLLKKLLMPNPEERLCDPSAIKAHPFFKHVDWDQTSEGTATPPDLQGLHSRVSSSVLHASNTKPDWKSFCDFLDFQETREALL